jgi:hypothetical protein
MLGVAGRNAANGQLAPTQGLDRGGFLEAVSAAWAQLDPEEFPFARSLAGPIRTHDDRKDFLAGIDLILRGLGLLVFAGILRCLPNKGHARETFVQAFS